MAQARGFPRNLDEVPDSEPAPRAPPVPDTGRGPHMTGMDRYAVIGNPVEHSTVAASAPTHRNERFIIQIARETPGLSHGEAERVTR